MPKWRKIHTKTVDSVDLNDMPDDFTRLLWMMLPLILDRRGRGMDSAVWVRSKAMPLREDVTCEMIATAIDWYAERGMVERYQVDDRRYFWIPTWHKYQGDTRREAESNFPAPPSYADPFVDDGPEDPQDDGPVGDQRNDDDKPNAGASQDQVGSRSRSEADAVIDSEAEKESIISATAPPPPPSPKSAKGSSSNGKLSEGQRDFLALFSAKRFANNAQRDAVLELERQHGTQKFLEAARWAAEKGMSRGNAITSLRKALPTWGNSEKKQSGNQRKDYGRHHQHLAGSTPAQGAGLDETARGLGAALVSRTRTSGT